MIAEVPPAELLAGVGLDPGWSTSVEVASHDGAVHRWHVIDRPGTDPAAATVVCVHGNPTWGVLWARVLRELDPAHRVVAPDQLSMGYSERVAARRYRNRVADVVDLLDALDLREPVWLVGQDWGGAIAMGVAVHHPERVAGLVLSNTGIAVPAGRSAPRLIRLAAAKGVHRLTTRSTPLFVRGTPWLPGERIDAAHRRALAAPYRTAADRTAVADFVADVPFDDAHPSSADIAEVADALSSLRVPVRLVWGGRDPVFDDSFADDLLGRFAAAELHRIADTGHLTVLEASIAPFVDAAIAGAPVASGQPASSPSAWEPVWASVFDGTRPDDIAVSDAVADVSVTRRQFADLVTTYADGLARRGVRPGDRVAVLVPPSVELLAAVYACWRVGAVTVVADRGLGLRGLGRAVRSARVAHVLGPTNALAAARVLRWAPGAAAISIDALAAPGAAAGSAADVAPLSADAPAAVVFTSGATGPAKGVRYLHGQLAAQRDALRDLYGITPADRFVAAFAPFAVFGPALGITTCFADMDVTAPATLTAAALDDACARVDATMVFASPAALANVVRTAGGPLPALARVRLVLSAGAPVPIATLRSMARLCPAASLHTPYGMTEVLPVADISLAEREAVGDVDPPRGVCVGRVVPGCEVIVDGEGDVGEILVHAPWMSSGYDRLWLTEQRARPPRPAGGTWHRSGDVGHLDDHGNLWIAGRAVHLIDTVDGLVAPVPVEVAVERVDGVARAAAVGVGPAGVQLVVIVVEQVGAPAARRRRLVAADPALTAAARAAAPVPVAAVWVTDGLPVDIRHNAKIDRTALARTMTRVLAGERP